MVSNCSAYLELYNYNIAPRERWLFLYLSPFFWFLFQRRLKSKIYLILWECTPNRGCWTRWCPEVPSNWYFCYCLIKDTAVNDLWPYKFVTFDKNKYSDGCYICSFQKERGFERKMRQRHTLTELLVGVYNALMEFAYELFKLWNCV